MKEPPAHPHPPRELDSRDCGCFLLDVVGQFSTSEIEVSWTDQRRASNDAVDQLIEQAWHNHVHHGTAKLFNGQLARLVDHHALGRRLQLVLGTVSYKEFWGTNLTNARLRYTHGPEVLANPLGVSAALNTSDGFIILGRRSQNVAFHAGRIHPFGGMVEPAAQGPIDPFASIVAELTEEMAIQPDQIRENICLGLVRDKQIVQPELIFDVTVDLDVPAVRQQANHAKDAGEHCEIIAVRSERTSIVTCIQREYASLTPVAMATLLLHGLRKWGCGWFTAARGYLHKVI